MSHTYNDYDVAIGGAAPKRTHGYILPPVHLSEDDYARLDALAQAAHGLGAEILERELDRAIVLPADELPDGVAQLGSWVEYVDLLQAQVRRVQLAAPGAADIDAGRVSILSPVGAALIGLRAEDTFGWTGENGAPRVLVVHRVEAA